MELRVNTETKKKITSLVIDNTKMLKKLLSNKKPFLF